LQNFYETLGASPQATAGEIKRSFRRRAKELHPDTVSGSDDRMRTLIAAYEVLSDAARRSEYDRLHPSLFRRSSFNYREFLRSQTDDFVSQGKLIFYDLLNSNDEEAVATYEQLRSARIDLREYMSHDDFMDCSFLLAEALERRGELLLAARLYKRLYRAELERPYFRHFLEEVVESLRTLVCFKMPTLLPAELVVENIEDLIDLRLSRKDSAFFHKKIAEIYSLTGDYEQAADHLKLGLELDDKLPGVKKLMEKIGFGAFHPQFRLPTATAISPIIAVATR
jgi:tetratricopeptide (TPR) repeat protein